MKAHFVISGMVAVAAAAGLVVSASAQGRGAQPDASAARPATVKPIKRMPDGVPDMRGAWNKVGGGLNEANPPKARIDTECVDAFRAVAEPAGFNNVVSLVPRPKAQHIPANPPKQGIVDPADRVLPFTPEGFKLRNEYAEKMGPPAESLKYVELSARCIPPGPQQAGNLLILQSPGKVVMLFDGDHGSRVIYTDRRPHPSQNVRTFGGDSIGHWEGNTLIVDTANLNGLAHFGVAHVFPPFSDVLHLTERFTVESPELIGYEIVYDDPKTFARPVKVAGYFYPANDDYEIEEVVCTEGSTTLRNIFGF